MSKKIILVILAFGILNFLSCNRQSNKESYEKDVLGIEWVKVEGGSFQMGSPRGDSAEKIHRVTLDSFYISKTEMTFAQYDAFCEATGRSKPDDEGWGRDNRPVINVCWHDAAAFCGWLSKRTGQNIHLPTEAQWEYAARGGGRSRKYKYSGSNSPEEVAWYDKNSGGKTHAGGQRQPNELGIYDMSGNVWEWCADWYDDDYYSRSPSRNPKGPSSGSYRVFRGGSWYGPSSGLRCASRYGLDPSYGSGDTGFRIARD